MSFFINLLLNTTTKTLKQSVTTIVKTKDINNGKNTNSNNISNNININNSNRIKRTTTMATMQEQQQKILANNISKKTFTSIQAIPIIILLILLSTLLHVQYANCQTQQSKLSQQHEQQKQSHAQSELQLQNKAQNMPIAHTTQKTIYAISNLIYVADKNDKTKTTTAVGWHDSNSHSNVSVEQSNNRDGHNIYVKINESLNSNQMPLLPTQSQPINQLKINKLSSNKQFTNKKKLIATTNPITTTHSNKNQQNIQQSNFDQPEELKEQTANGNSKNDKSDQSYEKFIETHINNYSDHNYKKHVANIKNATKSLQETENIDNIKQFTNSLIVFKQLFNKKQNVYENNKIKKLYNGKTIINFRTYNIEDNNAKKNIDENISNKFIMLHQRIVNNYINNNHEKKSKYMSANNNANVSSDIINKFMYNNNKMYTYYNKNIKSKSNNYYYNTDGKEHYYNYNTSSSLYVIFDTVGNNNTKNHNNRNNSYIRDKFITNYQNYSYVVVNNNNDHFKKFDNDNNNNNENDSAVDDVNAFLSQQLIWEIPKVIKQQTTKQTLKNKTIDNTRFAKVVNKVEKTFNVDVISLDLDNYTDEEFDSDFDNAQPNRFTNSEDNQKLMHLVMDGLGLQRLPDMAKINISQQEYSMKYREYLERVYQRKRFELNMNEVEWKLNASRVTRDINTKDVPLHILSIINNASFELIEHHNFKNMHHLKKEHRRKRDLFYAFRDYAPASQNMPTLANNFSKNSSHTRRAVIGNGKETFIAENEKINILLHFPLDEIIKTKRLHADDLEEANIRLMVIQSSALAWKHNKAKRKRKKKRTFPCNKEDNKAENNFNHIIENEHASRKQKHVINLKVYQRLAQGRRVWMDGHKIEIVMERVEAWANAPSTDETQSRWLQFDVTKAVEAWLRESASNLGLEVQCDNCQRVGARILSDMSLGRNSEEDQDRDYNNNDDDGFQLQPVLNIIGRLSGTLAQHHKPNKAFNPLNDYQSKNHHHQQQHSSTEVVNSCRNGSFQRCCRHTMEVVFKEIKGFEFILQPKVFDAGYCHGRCPPRYNPAHHHAMLQSLIWKQSRKRAPRPCCAPSKLVELEVLHVDEKDTEKLKISTWTDMRVIECACS